MSNFTIQKLVLALKLTLVALATILAILTLGYSNAYGAGTLKINLLQPPVQDPAQQFSRPVELLHVADGMAWRYDELMGPGSQDGPPAGGDDSNAPPPVPEPMTLILLGIGVIVVKAAIPRR